MKHSKTLLGPVFGLMFLVGTTGFARLPGPPPEALDACSDKSEGTTCSFDAPHGTVTGSCRSIQAQSVCAPDNPSAQHRGGRGLGDAGRSTRGRFAGPPPEALSACEGKMDGDACKVQTPRGDHDGRCRSQGGEPFCVPDNHSRAAGPTPGSGGER